MSSFFRKAQVVVASGLALAAAVAIRPAVAEARPANVLLIMTDQQSADVMSCRMGTQYLRTPAMDRLATGGMRFTRAYSANPLCMPLRNSLFTGRYPHETRVTRNADPPGGLDPAKFPCMGTYFRRAGYDAGYSGKWHLCFDAKDPAAHGFEIVTGRVAGDHDAGVTQGAAQFLSRTRDRPFLLVASYLNPHNICEWARRGAGMTQTLSCGEIGEPPPVAQCPPAPANLAPPKDEPDTMAFMRRSYHATQSFPVGAFTADDWRKQRWGYYRMVEKVDGEIGRLLEGLRRAGQEGRTLVVFTADHGDCTGAHGFNQKTVFYEESTRVPLLLAGAGAATGTCDRLVNTGVDILPTLLDFAGIGIPPELPGQSLRPLLRGEAGAGWRDYVVVENHMDQGAAVDGVRPSIQGRMVRTDRYKYCVYSEGMNRESLVDLQSDPGEMQDLARDPAQRKTLLEHRALLERFAREQRDPLAADLLAGDVAPRPFTDAGAGGNGKKKAKGR